MTESDEKTLGLSTAGYANDFIGEQTGSLDAMLGKVADFYEKEVENSTDQIKSLIEPIMIVFLAGIVGTIVLSIMMPMFEIYNQVG